MVAQLPDSSLGPSSGSIDSGSGTEVGSEASGSEASGSEVGSVVSGSDVGSTVGSGIGQLSICELIVVI